MMTWRFGGWLLESAQNNGKWYAWVSNLERIPIGYWKEENGTMHDAIMSALDEARNSDYADDQDCIEGLQREYLTVKANSSGIKLEDPY